MSKQEYKVLMGKESKGSILVRNEEELAYNLKGIAETELMQDTEFGEKYTECSADFSLVFGKMGENWEENFRYTVSVYSKDKQKFVKTYFFKLEYIGEDNKTPEIGANLYDYKNRQQRIFDNKVAHGFNTTNIYQEARYILEEVAELMRAVEKGDKENMLEELADIVIFSYGCAAVARIGDLDAKIFEKMDINESRVYTQNSEGDFIKKN